MPKTARGERSPHPAPGVGEAAEQEPAEDDLLEQRRHDHGDEDEHGGPDGGVRERAHDGLLLGVHDHVVDDARRVHAAQARGHHPQVGACGAPEPPEHE